MNRILILIALLLPLTVSAQAPTRCYAINGAVGYTMGDTADGRYAGWWCPQPWHWSQHILVMRSGYTLIHPTLPLTATPAQTADAYWHANVTIECSTDLSANLPMQRLCDAAYFATDATRPPSRWIVAPYTGATYRATYATSAPIDGIRTKTSNGKVLITTAGQPTPCFCTRGRLVEGTITYCSVGEAAQVVAQCRLR